MPFLSKTLYFKRTCNCAEIRSNLNQNRFAQAEASWLVIAATKDYQLVLNFF